MFSRIRFFLHAAADLSETYHGRRRFSGSRTVARPTTVVYNDCGDRIRHPPTICITLLGLQICRIMFDFFLTL